MSTQTQPDPDETDPGETDPREIDMDVVVAHLREMGLAAMVEQTGGGCATIYAGPTRPHPEDPQAPAYAAVAGPGRFGWGQRPSVGHLDEMYVGPDDQGETQPVDAGAAGVTDPAGLARLIAEQVALGLDPAAERAPWERTATRVARWCEPIRASGPDDDDTPGGVVVADQVVTVAVEHGALRVGIEVGSKARVFSGDGEGVPVVVEVGGTPVLRLDDQGRATLYPDPHQPGPAT